MSEKPRALGVVRLSVGNENQTGEETQRTRISKRADAEEMELVDFAVDIDVSASISPWVRPSLGDWLNNKKDQFDHIIILKIDRIARSVRHLSDIIEWCEANGKGLISCEEGFDLSKPWGKTIAKILAVVAEAELDAIKARNKASRETMRKTGRWPGGLVPFGRRAVKGDAGFTLELDPEYGPTLIEMIRRFIEKPSFSAVADWLNGLASTAVVAGGGPWSRRCGLPGAHKTPDQPQAGRGLRLARVRRRAPASPGQGSGSSSRPQCHHWRELPERSAPSGCPRSPSRRTRPSPGPARC